MSLNEAVEYWCVCNRCSKSKCTAKMKMDLKYIVVLDERLRSRQILLVEEWQISCSGWRVGAGDSLLF